MKSTALTGRRQLLMVTGVALLMAAATVVHAQSPAPTFSKSFSPSVIGPGAVSRLAFEISNVESSEPVTDLTFTDTLPTGMTIARPSSASTDCADAILLAPAGGSAINFSGGRLGGFSACSVTVNVTGTTPGEYVNLTSDLNSDSGNSGPATATLTIDGSRPGFVKTFTPNTISLGGTSVLTLTVDNTLNDADIFSLNFSDTLPTGMVIATPANASTDCSSALNPATLTAVSGTGLVALTAQGFEFQEDPVLGAGSICTVTVDVTTDTNGVFVNTTGELVSGSQSVSSGFATAALEVPVEFLVKTFIDDPVAPGGTVTLRFIVTNLDRNDAATSIAFDDDLDPLGSLTGLAPSGVLPADPCGVGSSLAFAAGTGVLSLSGGSLPAAGSCTFNVALGVPATADAGAYTNITDRITAVIDGEGVIGNTATDNLVVSYAPIFTKEFIDDPAAAGGSVTLRFTITNTFPGSGLTDIEFSDDLNTAILGLAANSLVTNGIPDPIIDACGQGSELGVFAFDIGGGNFITNPTLLEFTGGSLAPAGSAGDSCSFDVVLDVPPGIPAGTYTNTSSDVTGVIDTCGECADPVTGLAASGELVVIGAPLLTKEFTDDPALPGGTVTLVFSLSLDEFAAGDATDITFSDDLAATLAGLTATGATVNTCGGMATSGFPTTNFGYAGGSLTPGQSCTIELTLDVPSNAAAGSHTNTTSSVVATVAGVPGVVGNPAEDDLRIAGLALTKEFTDDPALPGDVVTLRFTLENMHPTDDASGIIFFDDLGGATGALPGLAAEAPLPDTSSCGAGSSLTGTTFLIFTGGSVDAGTSCSFDVTLRVPGAAADGMYNNVTSTISATLGGSAFIGDPARDVLTVDSNLLFFTKEFTDDPVAPGGTVTLEFTMANQATEAVLDIGFTDDLDAALSGLVATGLPISACGGTLSTGDGGMTIELNGGSLAAAGAAGDSCTFSVTLLVPVGAAVGATATNTTSEATGTLGGMGPTITGGPAIDDLRISPLNFTKAFDGAAVAGGTVVLTFSIVNLDAASEVSFIQFSDDLEQVIAGLQATGLPVSDVCGAGSVVGGTSVISLDGGSLGPGASCTFDVTLTVPLTAAAGAFTNITSALFVDSAPVGVPATADLLVEIESIPPTVTGVDSDPGTGDGVIDECETAQVEVSRLSVTFSEPVQDPPGDTDPDDVTNPDNYRVLGAGPDGDFATTACGTVFGDDVQVPILSVVYDDGGPTAAVNLSGALPSSQIRLLVCGSTSIYDLAGNPLDGTGDGTGGDDFALTFRSDPFNLLTNGHFDCDAAGWVLTSSTPGEIFHSSADVDNSAVSGSLEFMQFGVNTDFEAAQCAEFPSDNEAHLTAVSQLTADPGVQLSLTAGCTSYASVDCSGPSLGVSSITSIFGDSGGSWLPIGLTVTERPGRQSIRCSFQVGVPDGDDFTLRLDSAVLEVGASIFADGFESGDTSEWSATVGGSL